MADVVDVWRVVDTSGVVRAVRVYPRRPDWIAAVDGPGYRASIVGEDEWGRSPHLACLRLAEALGIEAVEIVAPGEPTRAEALTALRTQHAAEVAAAVRAEREATDAISTAIVRISKDIPDAPREYMAAVVARDVARDQVTALLSTAPAPTTVPATVVRAYLAAVTDHRRALASAMQPCISEPLAVIDTRAALVAALAGCP